jgi:hypothetical protein
MRLQFTPKMEARAWTTHALTTLGFVGTDGHFVAVADVDGHGMMSADSERYAERLAGSWNAFNGMPTDLILTIPKPVHEMLNEDIDVIAGIEKQRNDVRDSLKAAIARIEDMLKDDDGQAFKEARKALPGFVAAFTKAGGAV